MSQPWQRRAKQFFMTARIMGYDKLLIEIDSADMFHGIGGGFHITV